MWLSCFFKEIFTIPKAAGLCNCQSLFEVVSISERVSRSAGYEFNLEQEHRKSKNLGSRINNACNANAVNELSSYSSRVPL